MRIRFVSAVLGSFRGPPAAGALKEVRACGYQPLSSILCSVGCCGAAFNDKARVARVPLWVHFVQLRGGINRKPGRACAWCIK